MTAPIEIYRQIEAVIDSYAERKTKELVNSTEMSDAELHTARGKLQAVRDLLHILRSALGYTLEDI